jgi:hypothetical protein
MVTLEMTVRNMGPARIFSLGTIILTVIPEEPRGTYFIARISTGSHFFQALNLKNIVPLTFPGNNC